MFVGLFLMVSLEYVKSQGCAEGSTDGSVQSIGGMIYKICVIMRDVRRNKAVTHSHVSTYTQSFQEVVWVWDQVFPYLRMLCTLDTPSCTEKRIIILTTELTTMKMQKVMIIPIVNMTMIM